MRETVKKYLNENREAKRLSFCKLEELISINHPEQSMSDTKLSAVFKDPRNLSITDLSVIVEAMGLDKHEIFAILGEQEYRASENVDYKGATALIAEHNEQIRLLQERYEAQLERGRATREGMQLSFNAALDAVKEAHVADLAQRDERYETAVKHLRADFIKSESNFKAAMKSVKWWRGVAIGILSVVVFVVVYLIIDFSDVDTGLSNIIMRMIKEGLI